MVVTDTFKEKIIEKGINGTKISIHKNGANLEVYKPISKDASLGGVPLKNVKLKISTLITFMILILRYDML